MVIEEFNQLTPVEMIKGECSISDEVAVRNGEKVPVLVGGREGEEFITAWATVDGAWPELPNNQLLINVALHQKSWLNQKSGANVAHLILTLYASSLGSPSSLR